MIHCCNLNNNAGFQKKNKSLDSVQTAILVTVHKYMQDLFQQENYSLLYYMKEIPETLLIYYPDDIQSLTKLSIIYQRRYEDEKALEYRRRIETLEGKNEEFRVKN